MSKGKRRSYHHRLWLYLCLALLYLNSSWTHGKNHTWIPHKWTERHGSWNSIAEMVWKIAKRVLWPALLWFKIHYKMEMGLQKFSKSFSDYENFWNPFHNKNEIPKFSKKIDHIIRSQLHHLICLIGDFVT